MADEVRKTMKEKFTTTTAGCPVASDEHSTTVGPDGAIVLHDVYLVEKLAQFNRERVPASSGIGIASIRLRLIASGRRS
jgi:catalase